ncbi:MAG: fibronectin type III domain-containing protein [Spirochaetia bacterium]|nr:fibronectin type III domain-containing protein [Spirochaetia bacterium]
MKKNILKIAAATASAIITLAFLSCTQEGNVYNYNYTSTAPKAVTNVKATRIGESTVRLSWTAPKDNNIHAFYVGGTVAAKGDFAALDPDTVPVGQTYYNFKYAHQGFEWQFSVQTVSYDGTYSKPVTVTNSDVLSNSIYLKTVQNNPNSVKVYVAVSDVDNVGIEKVCYTNGGYRNSAQNVIQDGKELIRDSDGYYSFDAIENGNYSFAAELSDGTFIGPQSEYINTVSIK